MVEKVTSDTPRWLSVSQTMGWAFLAGFSAVSLASHHPTDVGYLTYPHATAVANWGGDVGAFLAAYTIMYLGWVAWWIPCLTGIWAAHPWLADQHYRPAFKLFGAILFFGSAPGWAAVAGPAVGVSASQAGGAIGILMAHHAETYFGALGSGLLFTALAVLALLLATEFTIVPLVTLMARATWGVAQRGITLLVEGARGMRARRVERVEERPRTESRPRPRFRSTTHPTSDPAKPAAPEPLPVTHTEVSEQLVETTTRPEPKTVRRTRRTKPAKAVRVQPSGSKGYELPPLDLLSRLESDQAGMDTSADLGRNATLLEETLADFGIEVDVVGADRGPVITRYELRPAPGVKVHRITALGDDIALIMKASSVRVVAPIPGKGLVGVEVPNSQSTIVPLRDILESTTFTSVESKLTLAIGKDVAGESLVGDLADMPHLLIAGTTGSGKTVCVNSLILSVLFNATPDEAKFIMIDPKKVELTQFNRIPHLLSPVVTDAKKASHALEWVVGEMERRYQLLAAAGVRNILGFNARVAEGSLSLEDEDDVDGPLPYLVIVVDELADLMMVAPKEIEGAIARLAQLSRAVGIHMILATQRPSVDVLTGVIKANFPARVSFQVASKVDSRTVLDMNGADKLLGKGDLLFLPPGSAKPTRAQGCLVSDAEIEQVVDFVAAQRVAEHVEEIAQSSTTDTRGRMVEHDDLYDDAKQVVLETGQASVSMLQRRMGLGYTRAARLIDLMERHGVVGPHKGHKARDILVDPEVELQQEMEHVDE